MSSQQYQRCVRCVLDTVGDPFIVFDENGVCNYCKEYDNTVVPSRIPPDIGEKKLNQIIEEIKRKGKHQKYDCLLGLSGGMDSTYIAYLAKKYGLRPFVIHLDNGWDSELAVKNIENILKKTGFDYYNYVIDWEEFKDIQLSYLKASVIDIEVVSDQAIFAVLCQFARKLRIKYIMMGDNPATERIMPKGWSYQKNDLANLKAIHKKFGRVKFKTYPLMGLYDKVFYGTVCQIRHISLLHFIPYNYQDVQKLLESEFCWKNYEWKHCESIFTKFYQGYILPKKFNADKRKAHLSDLILSGQKTRDEALDKLSHHFYYTKEAFKNDYDYVLRKFDLSSDEFEKIMSLPIVPHTAFPQDKMHFWYDLKILFWLFFYFKVETATKLIGRKILGPARWLKLKRLVGKD